MIGFLHPWALAGLVAAAIPILLHLLARRDPPTVMFPAVRYLIDTTREHRRRLKLQNWLLLLLRTLLIALLVLAAAAPTAPLAGVPGHAASALVLIVDNSASSGAVADGIPRLAQLQAAARAVLARATPDDALWLLTADGVPRRGDAPSLRDLVDQLEAVPRRLDLGNAVRLAGDVLAAGTRPGEMVLLSDLQASALSPANPTAPLLIGRAADAPARNVGVASVVTGPQPWAVDGGRVAITLIGDTGGAVPLSVQLGDRPPRQALGTVGGATSVAVPRSPGGWWTLAAELDPDELRLDDRRAVTVRVAPVARVDWRAAGRFVAAACEVLEMNGRIAQGNEVRLGHLGSGMSVIQPPEDPAALGALNRALERRGVAWHYQNLITVPAVTDSGTLVGRQRIVRRYTLESVGSGRTGVLATVARMPWIVRSNGVVLLGSRLAPEWTDLPVSAGFMPFMDLLLNRVARGEMALVDGLPGEPVSLPDLVTDVRRGARDWRVEGGGAFQPPDVGVYYLIAESDTIGALSVNLDPRESRLARAPDEQVRRLWRGARVANLDQAGSLAFASAALGDLRGPLLVAALLVALLELALASAWRRQR